MRRVSQARRHLPHHRSSPRRRRLARPERACNGVRPPRRSSRAPPAALRQVHALRHERPRRPRRKSLRSSPRSRSREPIRLRRSTPRRDLDSRHWLDGRCYVQLPSASPPLRAHHRRRKVDSSFLPRSQSISHARIRSRRQATRSSIASCGCRQAANARATSCWQTQPSSRPCSAAIRVWKTSGRTLRSSDAARKAEAAVIACGLLSWLMCLWLPMTRTRKIEASILSE